VQAFCKVGPAFLAAALLAVGCTHLPSSPSGPPNYAPDAGIDQAYVDHVERVARLSGVDVYWLNPPRKHAP